MKTPILISIVVAAHYMLTTLPAVAQSLKDQIVGTWSMDTNVEEYVDGKKIPWDPNAKGMLMFDNGGRFVQVLAEIGNRKKVEGNPAMNPTGKMIAYFGTYTVNETDKTVTYKIIGSSFPNWDGTAQTRSMLVDASKLVSKPTAPIPSAQGPFIPVVTYSRMK